jgi:hypothetical protein
VPRQWWPDIESANAVIESDGPWPSSSPESNGRFVPLDVDRHEGFAVVVGFGPARHGRDVLGFDEFDQTDTGLWDRRGGGGSEGHDLGERESLVAGREALHLRVSGDTGWSAFETRPEFEFAAFLCGPDVATVEIRRQRGVRTADLRVGPGWLAVVWAKDDPAQVLAFSARGTQSFSWTPPSKAA